METSTRPRKSRSAAIAWAFFLGHFGAHKFYLGRPGWGIAYAVLVWTFLPTILSLCEVIWFLCMGEEGFDRRYNR